MGSARDPIRPLQILTNKRWMGLGGCSTLTLALKPHRTLPRLVRRCRRYKRVFMGPSRRLRPARLLGDCGEVGGGPLGLPDKGVDLFQRVRGIPVRQQPARGGGAGRLKNRAQAEGWIHILTSLKKSEIFVRQRKLLRKFEGRALICTNTHKHRHTDTDKQTHRRMHASTHARADTHTHTRARTHTHA